MSQLTFIQPNWPAPANVKALQTTRQGGTSKASYASLNLAEHVYDNGTAVAHNRQLLSAYLPSEPVWLNQVHGIEVIDAAKSGRLDRHLTPCADGSFTAEKSVVCVTMTADCLPVLLCDNAGTVVAAVHAGWRGLCDGVIEAAVCKMLIQPNNVLPSNILAWLGPAIGANAFEVGAEVREQFMQKDRQAALAFKPRDNLKRCDKWLCDIYTIARQRLNNLGVTQIYGSSINEDFCTYSDEGNFFSFRRDNLTGRMASLIWLSD